jgi:hypothetical protein
LGGSSANRVRREKAVVHSGSKPARELVRSTLRRKSLIPGMIAHGFGDGLVAFLFFAKHL